VRQFKKDHYALGLHPRGYDLLIELIDLELGLAKSPETLYVLGYLLDGYSQRETAGRMAVHHRTVQNHVKKARRALGENYPL